MEVTVIIYRLSKVLASSVLSIMLLARSFGGYGGGEDTAGAGVDYPYRAALEGLLQRNIMPDGTEYRCPEDYRDKIWENHFAVCDVDSDGR